jgi:hypothetical protein
MSERRSYPIELTVNGRKIIEIEIDPHYEVSHADSINDDLILRTRHAFEWQIF